MHFLTIDKCIITVLVIYIEMCIKCVAYIYIVSPDIRALKTNGDKTIIMFVRRLIILLGSKISVTIIAVQYSFKRVVSQR